MLPFLQKKKKKKDILLKSSPFDLSFGGSGPENPFGHSFVQVHLLYALNGGYSDTSLLVVHQQLAPSMERKHKRLRNTMANTPSRTQLSNANERFQA